MQNAEKNYRVLSIADVAPKQRLVDKGSVRGFDLAPIEKDLSAFTDEQLIARLAEREEILAEMTKAVRNGDVRSMIVVGPPGVGKSYTVESVLSKENLFPTLGNGATKKGKLVKHEIVKGGMSSIGLYKKLHEFKEPGCVVVFDDCDTVLLDDETLNLLKAALDTSKTRKINWNKESRVLREEGLDNSFEFKGSAIFITNIKFDHVRSKKLKDHLVALESRSHYIDLEIDTTREKVLWMKVKVQNGMLKDYELPEGAADDILDYIETNQTRLRELSLRTVLKCADLRKAMPSHWKKVAEETVMRRV